MRGEGGREGVADVPGVGIARGRTQGWRQAFALIQHGRFISTDFTQAGSLERSQLNTISVYLQRPFINLIRKWAFACGVGAAGLIAFEHKMISNSLHRATTGLGGLLEPGSPNLVCEYIS